MPVRWAPGVAGSNPAAPTTFRLSVCNEIATEATKERSAEGRSFHFLSSPDVTWGCRRQLDRRAAGCPGKIPHDFRLRLGKQPFAKQLWQGVNDCCSDNLTA
jgi:hypothetical protein